jgi:hypothetical protein
MTPSQVLMKAADEETRRGRKKPVWPMDPVRIALMGGDRNVPDCLMDVFDDCRRLLGGFMSLHDRADQAELIAALRAAAERPEGPS